MSPGPLSAGPRAGAGPAAAHRDLHWQPGITGMPGAVGQAGLDSDILMIETRISPCQDVHLSHAAQWSQARPAGGLALPARPSWPG